MTGLDIHEHIQAAAEMTGLSDGSIPILDNSIIELLKPYLQISPKLFTKLSDWSYNIP